MKRHVFFLVFLAACVGGFYYFQARKHHIVRRPGAPFVPVEAKRRFEKAVFVSVSSSNFWPDIENTFKEKAKVGYATNAVHPELLWQQVRRFLQDYSKGTFDAYMDFKSAGLPFDFAFTGGNLRDLAYSITNNNTPIPADPRAKAREFWRIGSAADANGVGHQITDVSIERLTVSAGRGTGPHTPTYWVAAADTGAPQYVCPSVVASQEEKEKIRQPNTSALYAVVGLACKIDHETDYKDGHYLHLCFFWSDQYSRWLPVEMLDDHGFKVPLRPPIRFPDSYNKPLFF